MRPKELDLDVADFDADGLASESDSSGTTVELDGALISGGTFTSSDGLGRIIVITDSSTSDQSDVTFTVTGTDPNGDAISETITGPTSGATVVSTKYFKTVSSVTVSAAQGGSETVNIGTRNTTLSAASKVVPLNFYSDDGVTISVDVTGTINFTVQETFDSVLTQTNASGNIVWADISALASKTADTTSTATRGATAVRVVVNSYTNTAELQARIISTHR